MKLVETLDQVLGNGAILEQAPTSGPVLEEDCRRFCLQLGFTPSRTGTFGVARKYWAAPIFAGAWS